MRRYRRKSSAGPDEQDLLAVIGAIYDSALDLSNWRVAMQRISQVLGGHRALMFVPDLNAQGFWAAHDIGPDMMKGYEEHYRQVDVWTNRCHPYLNKNGATTLGEIVIPEREYARSEFWNDFTRPADIFRIAAVAVDIADDKPACGTLLSVYRPRASESFDESTRRVLRTLQPHIRRSLAIGKLLAGVSAERAYLDAMLDCIRLPVFACAANAVIIYANAAGEALLRENGNLKSNKGGRLATATLAGTETLHRAIADAATMVIGAHSTTDGNIHLSSRAGERPATITIVPLRCEAAAMPCTPFPKVLVLVQQEQDAIDDAKVRLRDAYQLTETELRFVAAMLEGGALPAVARRLGIAHNTARTHLKHVFEKTQTHRQAELVQLVHGLTGRMVAG